MADLSRDLELLYEIGSLRYKQRAWNRFFTPHFANITEHSFRVMWLSLIIAKREGYKDLGKIAMMALVHDMGESRGVDVDYVSRLYAERNEEKAMRDTLEGTSVEEELWALWKEAEERKTQAAQIIKDADNLDIDLELNEQEASTGNQIRQVKESLRKNVYEKKLFTESAKRIWEEIQRSNPFDWMRLVSRDAMEKAKDASEFVK